MVLTHARALLTSTSAEGSTTYLDADYNDPDLIITGARAALDFDRPIAVLFMGVFGYLDDPDDAHSVIRRVMAAVPSGSHMALWDATATTEAARLAAKAQADAGSPYATRSVEQIRSWFDGLDLVEPGVVPITFWRPDPTDIGGPEDIEAYGGIGRKP
jgi:O-methyltransferase involved in polyketide biosynthesis